MNDQPIDLSAQLKSAVVNSGLSVNQVALKSGVPQQVLQRFVAGERENLRLDTAGKLAGLFGMRLTRPRKVN